jgi:hypothetical protein
MKKNTIKVNGNIYNVVGTCAAYVPSNWNNKGNTIYQAYARPSYNKISLWYRIERICKELKGYNLHITSTTCSFFSCFFEFKHAGKKYRMSFYPSRWYVVNRIV